jgi:FkbH-like protein
MPIEFAQLKKNTKKDAAHLQRVKMALLGDSSTQLLHQAVQGYGFHEGFNFDVYEADYDQIDLAVMDPQSELYQFQPKFVILFFAAEKLMKKFYKLDAKDKSRFAQSQIDKITSLYQTIQKNSSAKVILFNVVEINDAVFGHFANKVEASWVFQVRKLNFELMQLSRSLKDLFILDLCALAQAHGRRAVTDRKMYVNADMVLNLDFLPVVAKHTTDIVKSLVGQVTKCVILDLDNTLWGGVIGDDGLENIQIGDLGIGKAFSDFQLWLKQLKERGIVLAVCSKNTEAIAKEAFEKHPDMILRLDDFAVFAANWDNKIDNIKYIQKVLNIGFDSMVFFDDSPFEREFIKSMLPEITVPDLPADPAEYVEYLSSQNLFETASFTGEDSVRTEQYQQEVKRVELQAQFKDADEFLADLNMTAQVDGFEAFNTPRVAQLTQRSNQFNLRTVRYTEEDIKRIAASKHHVGMAFSLQDKFGDYGLIGVVILEKKSETFFIDTWIMSCRVLKRGVEAFMLNEMVQAAKKAGLKKLTGEYLLTPKNGIVKTLLPDLGFKTEGPSWALDVQAFNLQDNHITKP